MSRTLLCASALVAALGGAGESGCDDKASADWKACDAAKDRQVAIKNCEAAVAKDAASRSGKKAATRLAKLRDEERRLGNAATPSASVSSAAVPGSSSSLAPVLASTPSAAAVGSTSASASQSVTELSNRAHVLLRPRTKGGDDAEPTRVEVVRALGTPTWAVLPSDKGPFAMQPGDAALELYWRNGNCAPVSVSFDGSMHVTGGSEGRLCAVGVDTNPDGRYSCALKDRQRFCQ